jgi:hypothetical protein
MRQIQHLATDTETKILRDLDDKVHRLNIMSFQHPELAKVQTKTQIRLDTIYAFDVLLVSQQAFKMYQRRVLKEKKNENCSRNRRYVYWRVSLSTE